MAGLRARIGLDRVLSGRDDCLHPRAWWRLRPGAGFPRPYGEAAAHGHHDSGVPGGDLRSARAGAGTDPGDCGLAADGRAAAPAHRAPTGDPVMTEHFFTTW